MTRLKDVLAALLVVGVVACSGGEPEEGTDTAAAPTGDSMGAMAGTEGMSGMGMPDTARMQAHLRQMEGATGDSLIATRDQHRQMVANMLAQMNSEMRDMGMAADPEWNATVDSLRSDLTRMPEMSASEMVALMPDHRRRVEQLMASHEEMMRQMGH
jgi:hypothetical protein